MPAKEVDPKETAKALYSVLKELMALFKSGKIALPTVRFDAQANPAVAVDASPPPHEQQENLYIMMVIAKAEAALEVLRETYDDDSLEVPK